MIIFKNIIRGGSEMTELLTAKITIQPKNGATLANLENSLFGLPS